MQHFHSALLDEHNDLATAITLLDDWATHNAHTTHQPGLALGLVYDGDLIWGKGYGFADVARETPVTLDTRFRIASISKTFTGTAIMQLCEAGKLQLDDAISQYLDWFDLQYEGEPPITIRQCLTHSAGLPRDGYTPMWEEDNFPDWQAVIENTKKRKMILPPSQNFAYSNLGYALLGGVVQAITGQTWNDYVQEQILNPLGMAQTLTAAGDALPDLAVGYLRPDAEHQRKGVGVVDARGFDSATGMASTVNDLAMYARFHLGLDDNNLLSAYSLREMHRPHFMMPKFDAGYGLGISVHRIDDWTITGHGGGYKGYLTGFYLSREHKAGFIVLTNAIDSNPFNYHEKAVKLVLPELAKLKEQDGAESDGIEAYTGRYQSDWVDARVVVRNKQLQIVYIANPLLPPNILKPAAAPHSFITTSDSNPGQVVRFEMSDDGKAARMFIENEYSTRIE